MIYRCVDFKEMTNLNIDFLHYWDLLKEKLTLWWGLLKEKLTPWWDLFVERLTPWWDLLVEKLTPWWDLFVEKLAPLMEKLESFVENLPYYPHSVMWIAAAISLLLAALLISRRRSRRKSKRPKATVTGVAVGLSSHEEFNCENAPIGNAGGSTVTTPTSTTPTVTASTIVAPEPPGIAAPGVTYPSVADPAFEQAVKDCQEEFQEIYMEMYIELGFTSDFEQFRTDVVRRLKEGKETYHAISEFKMTPEAVVLVQMASVAGNILQSGGRHAGKGQLDIHGQELHRVYCYALNTMQEKGFASSADVQNKVDFMEKMVQELG